MPRRFHAHRLSCLILALVPFGAATVSADCGGDAPIPSLSLSTATGNAGSLFLVPSGSGKTLAQMGLTVSVQLLDCDGLPLPYWPWQDVWLGPANPGDSFQVCGNPFYGGIHADGNANELGQMTISGGVAAGGLALSGTRVFVAGQPLESTLPINITSCDINGDLRVNLADLGEFGADLVSGTHPARSDFNGDGLVNMLEVGEFAFRYGASCP
jgi:hypothetical protein